MIRPQDLGYSTFLDWLSLVGRQRVVLDLGTYARFGKELATLRSLFDGCAYFAMGYRIERTVCDENHPDVDGDIHDLPFRDASVGGIICKEVLEHVQDPARAVREIHRVLQHEGLVFCSVPFVFPYHGRQDRKLKDLWRFTRDGIRTIFRDFAEVKIVPLGGPAAVLRVLAPDRLRRLLEGPGAPLVNAVDRWFGARNLTPRYLVLARK